MKYPRFIDAHSHIYPTAIADRAARNLGAFYRFDINGAGTYEDLEASAVPFGAAGFFLLAVATNAHQVEKVNDFVASAAALSRSRGFETVGFAGMHQDYENMEAELDRCRAMGMIGVKLHPDIQKMDLLSPQTYALCEIMEGRMPLFLHMGDERPEYRFSEPKKLAKLLVRFPRLTVIAAHLGGYRAWDEAEAELIGAPHVYYDISSTLWAIPPERAAALTEKCGYDRVFFGTDYPVYRHEAYLSLFDALALPAAARDAVLYENAHRFMREWSAQ